MTGEVATMAGKDRLYCINRFTDADSFTAFPEVRLPVSVGFQVGEDVGSAAAKSVDFKLHLWDWEPGDDFSVTLNGASVEGLEPSDPDRHAKEGQWLQGTLDARLVRRGENRLDLAVKSRGESASSPVVFDTAQLRVRCES